MLKHRCVNQSEIDNPSLVVIEQNHVNYYLLDRQRLFLKSVLVM